jgi:hypothetical protein
MFRTIAVFDRCRPISSRSDAARRLSPALTYPINDTTPMVTRVSRTKAAINFDWTLSERGYDNHFTQA